jgi:hypothetical protein
MIIHLFGFPPHVHLFTFYFYFGLFKLISLTLSLFLFSLTYHLFRNKKAVIKSLWGNLAEDQPADFRCKWTSPRRAPPSSGRFEKVPQVPIKGVTVQLKFLSKELLKISSELNWTIWTAQFNSNELFTQLISSEKNFSTVLLVGWAELMSWS